MRKNGGVLLQMLGKTVFFYRMHAYNTVINNILWERPG